MNSDSSNLSSSRAPGISAPDGLFFHLAGILPSDFILCAGFPDTGFLKRLKDVFPQKNIRAYFVNPLQYARELLSGNIGKPGIDARQAAVGEVSGCIKISVNPVTGSVSYGQEPETGILWPMWCPAATIDSLCGQAPENASFGLLINSGDILGAALAGAVKTLPRTSYLMASIPAGQERALDQLLSDNDFVSVCNTARDNGVMDAVYVKSGLLPILHNAPGNFCSTPGPACADEGTADFSPLFFGGREALLEAIHNVPLLRRAIAETTAGTAPGAVLCHSRDLDEAKAFYMAAGRKPVFYVLTSPGEALPAEDGVLAFPAMEPGVEVRLYFHPAKDPADTFLTCLCLAMHGAGRMCFDIEASCCGMFSVPEPLGDFMPDEWERILAFANRLADAESQYCFLALCRTLLEGEPGYLPVAGYGRFFHPGAHVLPDDVLCEDGCLPVSEEGLPVRSTTIDFYEAMQGRGRIYGFEPIISACEKLQHAFANLEIVHMVQKALWSRPGSLWLERPGMVTFTEDQTQGNCSCTSIDQFFADKYGPTAIKLDISAVEREALFGAAESIDKIGPKLMLGLDLQTVHEGEERLPWLGLASFLGQLPYRCFCANHRFWLDGVVLYGARG